MSQANVSPETLCEFAKGKCQIKVLDFGNDRGPSMSVQCTSFDKAKDEFVNAGFWLNKRSHVDGLIESLQQARDYLPAEENGEPDAGDQDDADQSIDLEHEEAAF